MTWFKKKKKRTKNIVWKIAKQPNWDENIWENYEEKFYKENINLN